MNLIPRAALALLVLVVISLPVQALGLGPTNRSEAVYPAQELPLRFYHQRHVQLGLQCTFCHSGANESMQVEDDLLPGHAVCNTCHIMTLPNAAELYPPASCETCHPGHQGAPGDLVPGSLTLVEGRPAPPAVVVPPARLHFPHARHVRDQGIACETCHEGVAEADLATREHLPSMATCVSCHNGRQAPDACATCHLSDDGGLLLTQLDHQTLLQPSGRFRADDHRDPAWRFNHRGAARAAPEACAACHQQVFCEDCHSGRGRIEELHPGHWILSHGREAMANQLACQSCHDLQEFCSDCHETMAVAPGVFPGASAGGGLAFHPDGWADFVASSPQHHSVAARRSIESCSACHSEQDCLTCHIGINPHGSGFGGGGRSLGLQNVGAESCATCHTGGIPAVAE